MIKYSVIIPFFNSERTIERCLRSLLKQAREDMEIIAVNDGSTDTSRAIVARVAEMYPCVKLIDQENAGVSQARNVALRQAKGKYITLVDSDDYVTDDYFEKLDLAGDEDLVVFSHKNVGDVKNDQGKLFEKLKSVNTTEERLQQLLLSRLIMPPWNKRFSAQLIYDHELYFEPALSTGEDFLFCMTYALLCKKIEIMDECLLCVDISDQGSLSRKYRPCLEKQLQLVYTQIVKVLYDAEMVCEYKDRLLAITDYLYIRNVFTCICEEFKAKKLDYRKDKARIREICNIYTEPFTTKRCNVVHRVLRAALKRRMHYLFYSVSYVAKGRKYTNL